MVSIINFIKSAARWCEGYSNSHGVLYLSTWRHGCSDGVALDSHARLPRIKSSPEQPFFFCISQLSSFLLGRNNVIFFKYWDNCNYQNVNLHSLQRMTIILFSPSFCFWTMHRRRQSFSISSQWITRIILKSTALG